MNKNVKLLIAVAPMAALLFAAAACGSSGNSSLPSATAAGANSQDGNQPGNQTSGQAAAEGCTVIDATDEVALTASGVDYPAFCRYFTDGQFTSQAGSQISMVGDLDGSWAAGSVPPGSVPVCSGTYYDQGSTLPEGDALTIYDTAGEVPGVSPINSLCDDLLYASGENNG
jgi:hypothetical protein